MLVSRRAVTAVLVLALGLTVTACGGNRVFDDLRDDLGADARVRPYRGFSGLVAHAAARANGRGEGLVVRGTVTEVWPGRSMRWDVRDDREQRILLPFGDGQAMASTCHLTVVVDEVVVGSAAADPLTVGLSVDPSIRLADVRDALRGLDAVFFLERSAVFDYAEGVWAIGEDGALMATVDQDGSLHFPLLDGTDQVQPRGVTLAELRRLARDAH